MEFRGRGPIRCWRCNSLERTRVLRLLLETKSLVMPGMTVLHCAPEPMIGEYICDIVGHENYVAVDYAPELYKRPFEVKKIDLVSDAENLPDNAFDLVLHSHVMEHLPCDFTHVMWHLHRAVKNDGLHVFALPIIKGRKYECDLSDLSERERRRRFGHIQHYHNIGDRDLGNTLGKMFNYPEYNLEDIVEPSVLRRFNIPDREWKGFGPSSFFILAKSDLKLASK